MTAAFQREINSADTLHILDVHKGSCPEWKFSLNESQRAGIAHTDRVISHGCR